MKDPKASRGWTSVSEVKERIRKEWDKGRLLKAFWTGEGIELPFRLVLRGPTSEEWSDRFDEARLWIASLESLPLEWRDFTHPRLGRNRVPIAAVWPEIEGLLSFLGQTKEARRFRTLADRISGRFPSLTPWIANHPFTVLEGNEDWDPLLSFLDWMALHPRPSIYLRQIDLPGVHTKFLEGRKGLLTNLLDLVLPSDAVDKGQTGVARFTERYGFLSKPRLVRFRHLDPGFAGPRDQTWRLDDWARWESPPARVFITENEVNFLAFPACQNSMAVFGAGYGFEGWEAVSWLDRAEVWYWGDLDTHGFAILDQLRSQWPTVRSFLMDERTLVAHRSLWGEEPEPANRNLTRLSDDERTVYEGLVNHRWGPQIRLEQERIGYGWVMEALSRIIR